MRLIQMFLSLGLMTSTCFFNPTSAVAAVPSTDSALQNTIQTKGLQFSEFAMTAKISHPEAQVLALKEQPGQVVAAALKSFEGILVWRVKILGADRTLHELMINAADGSVRANTLLALR